MNFPKLVFSLILSGLAATAQAQFGDPGINTCAIAPAYFSDKVVPHGNGFAEASIVPAPDASRTNFQLFRINGTGIPLPNPPVRCNTQLNTLQPMWRGLTEAPGGYLMAAVGLRSGFPARWELVLCNMTQKFAPRWTKYYPLNIAPGPILPGCPANGPWQVGEVFYSDDGHFVVVGQTRANTSSTTGQMWAARIDANGNLNWIHCYETNTYGWTVSDYPGGGYLVAGNGHVWRLWYNDGEEIWDADITLPDDPHGHPYLPHRERIIQLQTNGFGIAGTLQSSDRTAVYYAKFSWNDGQQFEHVYGDVANNAPVFFNPPNTPTALGFPVNANVELMNVQRVGEHVLAMAWRENTAFVPLTTAIRGIRMDLNGNVQTSGDFINPTACPVIWGDFAHALAHYAFGGTTGMYGAPPGGAGVNGASHFLFQKYADAWAPFVPDNGGMNRNSGLPVPNPATDWLTVDMEFPDGGQIRILGADGRAVLEKTISEGENQPQLDVAALPRGLYFLETRRAGNVQVDKVFLK